MNISSSALSLRTLVPIITEQLGVDVMNALGCSRERSTALTTSPPATSDGYRCTDGRELASGRRRVLLVEPQCRSPRVITSLIPLPGPAALPPGVVRSDHPASSEWNGPVEEPTISSSSSRQPDDEGNAPLRWRCASLTAYSCAAVKGVQTLDFLC